MSPIPAQRNRLKFSDRAYPIYKTPESVDAYYMYSCIIDIDAYCNQIRQIGQLPVISLLTMILPPTLSPFFYDINIENSSCEIISTHVLSNQLIFRYFNWVLVRRALNFNWVFRFFDCVFTQIRSLSRPLTKVHEMVMIALCTCS